MGDSSSVIEPKPKTWGGFWDIFGEVLVDFMDINVGDRIFDIGTGGGSVLYPLLRRVGDTGKVIGFETCDHCAKATTAEIERCNIKNAEVHFGDACENKFADDSFDFMRYTESRRQQRINAVRYLAHVSAAQQKGMTV